MMTGYPGSYSKPSEISKMELFSNFNDSSWALNVTILENILFHVKYILCQTY